MKEGEIPVNWQEKYLSLKKEYEEFAYIVSHDLKAPLRAIHNLSGWICEDLGDALPEETKENVRLLQNRTTRMEGKINAILQLSRVERMDLELQEVNVSNLVEEIVSRYHPSNAVHWQIEELPAFTTYAKKLETVFHHLLRNAISFNQNQRPVVSVSVSEDKELYSFQIKDNGTGIPPEAHEKVFHLFYTVQPKDKVENLGVGLTLARKIIHFVGGTIDLNSELGKGSVFTFTWPKEIAA